jgi:homoserine kinase
VHRLHQPQRADSVYPYLGPVVQAALDAGACAAYLSGAGPTVMALVAPELEASSHSDLSAHKSSRSVGNVNREGYSHVSTRERIADAMIRAALASGCKGQVSSFT